MDNPETLAAMDTQDRDRGQRHTKHKNTTQKT